MNIRTKNRGHRADQKQIERIETIWRTGVQLFSTKGYLETSMDDIAKTSRLTKGGVYYYFRSKEEILYFIFSTCMDSKLRTTEEALIGIDDALEKIRVIIFQLIDYYTGNSQSTRITLGESHHLSRKHLRIIEAKRGRYQEIVSGVISDFLGRSPGASALTLTFLALLDGICLRFDPKDEVKPEDVSRLVLGLFVDAARNTGLVMMTPAAAIRS